LEKLFITSLTFTFNNILDNNQHGFRRGRSVETNLLSFVNTYITYNGVCQTKDVICTDFSKAFYFVTHSVLIAKLCLFGIHDPLFIYWFISSYLVDRSQQVIINGFLSDKFPVSSGVPQGPGRSLIIFTVCHLLNGFE